MRDTVRKEYPSFNLHEDGLWHVIGEHRPVLLELPEAMDLYIDEELFPEKAFRWKDQIFLPPSVHELWGMRRAGTPGQKYPLLWDFLAEHSGKAFGLWDEQTNSVRITTLRLYYQGKPLPVRGWLREEPYLPWPELFSVFQEIGLVEHGGPGKPKCCVFYSSGSAGRDTVDRFVQVERVLSAAPLSMGSRRLGNPDGLTSGEAGCFDEKKRPRVSPRALFFFYSSKRLG